jgi:hypothetical protein
VATSTESYAKFAARLRDLDGSVFAPHEAQILREAADARLFGDHDQMAAVARALELLDVLVEAARLSSRTSTALADMLCAIETVPAHR